MTIRIRKRTVDVRKLKGFGKTDLSPVQAARVGIPPEPTYDEDDRTLRDEQQVARTEMLMMKGIRDRRQLMMLLQIDSTQQMGRYMDRVIARWELIGSTQDYSRHRGEGLSRLDLIESELWTSVSNESDKSKNLTAIKYILEVQKQRGELLGLTPKVIERITVSGEAVGTTVSKNIAGQERLTMLAERMLKLVAARTQGKTIDHDEAEDIEEVDPTRRRA